MRIERILCPVDFSEYSRRAVEHAVAMAKWYEASLVGLYVVEAGRLPLEDYPPYTTPLVAAPDYRERLRAKLETFLEPATKAGIPTVVEVAEGVVGRTIVEKAAALPAQLVVIGSHGHGAFERLVLGSVTEKVLRTATCPVLTVPAPRGGAVEPRSPLFGTVLCPVDFSDGTERAVAAAASLAREAEAHLILLHVVPMVYEEVAPHYDLEALRLLQEKTMTERLREMAASLSQGELPEGVAPLLPVEPVVLTGKAYRGILRLASERDAGVIVMGVSERSVLDVALFGSTTNQVVRGAHCPVLTLRI